MNPYGDTDMSSLVLGSIFMAVLVAVIGTWPVCALLLWAYRRSIDRGMRRSSAPLGSPATPAPQPIGADRGLPPPPPSPPLTIALVEGEDETPVPMLEVAGRAAVRLKVVFVAAGLGYGLSITAVYHYVENLDWGVIRPVALTALLAWPIVPTLIALSPSTRRTRWLAWLGYLTGVVVLLLVGGDTSLIEGLALTAVVVVVPALFVLATGAPALRGAAWLVTPGLIVLTLAAMLLYLPLLYLRYGRAFDHYAWSQLGYSLGLLGLLAAYGLVLARLYQAKWASDQTLLILQWWFVAALWVILNLATQGAQAALLTAAAYGVLLVILFAAALLPRPDPKPSVRLLLLRTFGSRERSARLLRDLTQRWRWVGSVELITGTDLASEILEPDEFLDFIRGKLGLRFVTDQASLRSRLQELDLLPDRDGRYRVNELLCHDDTWRPAVEALVPDVDAVLLDLRGFTGLNTGVVHELERLVALAPLERVVALVDPSTDRAALQWAMDRAAALAPESAPLRNGGEVVLRTVFLPPGTRVGLSRLLAAVSRAATLPTGTGRPAVQA
ncbi:MAG TPA: hypothetical protein VEQ66_11020 [Propionibacteriaceae bacterium]|nr:hypothetical protein [Propionibacteriaceae bacterium]